MKVYVCCSLVGVPSVDMARVRAACQMVLDAGHVPLAPALHTLAWSGPPPLDPKRARRIARAHLDVAEAVWLFGTQVTDEMEQEILAACHRGVPVVPAWQPLHGVARCEAALEQATVDPAAVAALPAATEAATTGAGLVAEKPMRPTREQLEAELDAAGSHLEMQRTAYRLAERRFQRAREALARFEAEAGTPTPEDKA